MQRTEDSVHPEWTVVLVIRFSKLMWALISVHIRDKFGQDRLHLGLFSKWSNIKAVTDTEQELGNVLQYSQHHHEVRSFQQGKRSLVSHFQLLFQLYLLSVVFLFFFFLVITWLYRYCLLILWLHWSCWFLRKPYSF